MPSDGTKGATGGLERRISSIDEKSHERIKDIHKLCIRIKLGIPMFYMTKKQGRNFNWSSSLPR